MVEIFMGFYRIFEVCQIHKKFGYTTEFFSEDDFFNLVVSDYFPTLMLDNLACPLLGKLILPDAP